MIRQIDLDEKRWRKRHTFEIKNKRNFLQGLSAADSWKMMRELYEFAREFHPGASPATMDKIKVLARVRALFGKVK